MVDNRSHSVEQANSFPVHSISNWFTGMLWHRNTGEVFVKDVKAGGAAEAAGVQPGRKVDNFERVVLWFCTWKVTTVLTIQNFCSIIHRINGQPMLGMDTRQVRDQILGVCLWSACVLSRENSPMFVVLAQYLIWNIFEKIKKRKHLSFLLCHST